MWLIERSESLRYTRLAFITLLCVAGLQLSVGPAFFRESGIGMSFGGPFGGSRRAITIAAIQQTMLGSSPAIAKNSTGIRAIAKPVSLSGTGHRKQYASPNADGSTSITAMIHNQAGVNKYLLFIIRECVRSNYDLFRFVQAQTA